MKYGPNSEQLEAYLSKVADLDADDWSSLAPMLKDSRGPRAAAAKAIETAHARAAKHGLQSEVDAATREAHRSMDSVLNTNTGLQEAIAQDTEVAALRAVATSGATLLVLRPLLSDDEFATAWPMRIVDPRSLPHRVHVPRIGAVG